MTMKGRKHSLETKLKMSLAAKGNKSFTGHKHTEETKRKMRGPRPERRGIPSWNKGKKSPYMLEINSRPDNAFKRTGPLHHSWKGGITPKNIKIRESPEGKAWRKSVLKRDNYTCIWCGEVKNVQVDHIKPWAYFPESRTDIVNGRTLCKECHKKSLYFCKECGLKIR